MKKSTLWNSYWKIKDSITQMKMLIEYENYDTEVFVSLDKEMSVLYDVIKEVIKRAEARISGSDQEAR